MDFFVGQPPPVRIVLIVLLAVVAHLVVRGIQRGAETVLRPPGGDDRALLVRFPKAVTMLALVVSMATFVLYFAAFGLVLAELGFPLSTYVASATIIALAVGFGSQGLVQDVVSGLTMIFSNAINVGDLVEISGQIGRIERVGLRFTVVNNVLGQRVLVPNRNIGVVGRYRGGGIRAYVDVQVPDGADASVTEATVMGLARGLHAQHAALIGVPESLGIRHAGEGGWQFIRVKVRMWPGQQPLVETVFRQRVLATMRKDDASYADWMVTTTYRASEKGPGPGPG